MVELSLVNLPLDECHSTLLIKSTLVQVMAWCRQAASHCLSQCWPHLCRHMASLCPNELTHLPCAAYMRQWTWSALVHVMACRLFGGKPLPELMLIYCHFGPKYSWNKLQWNLNPNSNIFIHEIALKMSAKWRSFRPRENELLWLRGSDVLLTTPMVGSKLRYPVSVSNGNTTVWRQATDTFYFNII